jgi:transcriptional regulator with XRE-family HTH domain
LVNTSSDPNSEGYRAFVQLSGQFAGRLTQLREDAGLTFRELSAQSGIKPSTLHALEQPGANPGLETLAKLKQAFHLRCLEELFGPVDVNVSFPTT